MGALDLMFLNQILRDGLRADRDIIRLGRERCRSKVYVDPAVVAAIDSDLERLVREDRQRKGGR